MTTKDLTVWDKEHRIKLYREWLHIVVYKNTELNGYQKAAYKICLDKFESLFGIKDPLL